MSSETWRVIFEWGPVAFTAVNALFTLMIARLSRTFAARHEVIALSHRIDALEAARAGAPGWAVMNQVREQLAEMDGDLKAVNAQLQAMHESQAHLRASVDLIQQHLMESKL